jgi:ABC-type antimicrobial peptide transport system permease subunit
MRSRIITIIVVGITLGFLLGMGMGMGMVALLQAVADGNNTGLEVAFTLLVVFMGAMLISYVVRTTDA